MYTVVSILSCWLEANVLSLVPLTGRRIRLHLLKGVVTKNCRHVLKPPHRPCSFPCLHVHMSLTASDGGQRLAAEAYFTLGCHSSSATWNSYDGHVQGADSDLYSSPLLPAGEALQDPQWMSETTDSMYPISVYTVFSCAFMYIGHSKVNNNN